MNSKKNDTKITLRKRLMFQERFKGKIALIGKEGSIGMIARSSVPIQKSSILPPPRLFKLGSISPYWIQDKSPKSVNESYMELKSYCKKRSSLNHFPPHIQENGELSYHKDINPYIRQSIDSGKKHVIERFNSIDLRKVKFNENHVLPFVNINSPLSIPSYSNVPSNFNSPKNSELITGLIDPMKAGQRQNKQIASINRSRYRVMIQRMKKSNNITPINKRKEKSFLDQNDRESWTAKNSGIQKKGKEYPWFSAFDRQGDEAPYEEYLDEMLRDIKAKNL